MHVTRLAVHGHGVVAVADGVDDRAIGIELLALLIVVRDLHVGAAPHLAAIGASSPSSSRSSVVLPAPFGPIKPDAIAAHDAHGEVADDDDEGPEVAEVLSRLEVLRF